MKISINWAQRHSNVPLMPSGKDELVIKIGAQLGAVEEVVETGPKYDKVVVARVVSCVDHPNADKLHVCKIDDGGVVPDVTRDERGHVEVVCGAPNAREGILVAWLPPGSTVPSTLATDPFVLEARELRGVVSNGMLASPRELGISDEHEGILEIDPQSVGDELAKPGTPFKKLYGLDDVIIDVENKMFTHRPDCFGILGVARELAGIQHQAFKSPDWYLNTPEFSKVADEVLQVTNDVPDLVPRFMAVAMNDVKVGPSPIWLQAGLTRIGMKPINNVVDITNYLMYLTGQPLHAYDADKLPTKNTLGARLSRKGEKVSLLNGKTLELQDESTVVITSGETVVGVGGAMGGKDTEVSAETKNIIIECATFDMYSIRRTSMKYGLFTDAVTRFNKGQSALQNDRVIAKALEVISKETGGKQTSTVYDLVSNDHGAGSNEVEVSAEFINARLGTTLSAEQIKSLLENVEFGVKPAAERSLLIAPPFWRTDIEIAEDIVEEVGRLYGFDHVPLVLPLRTSRPTPIDASLALQSKLREVLAKAGANEVLTYSFVHGKLLNTVGHAEDASYKLSNALSPDLQYYRQSLTPSLLEKVHPNIKSGYDKFALFEIGKTHIKSQGNGENDLPDELPATALVVAAKQPQQGAAYYQARAYTDELARQLGLTFTYGVIDSESDSPVARPFDNNRSSLVIDASSNEVVGIVGEYRTEVIKALKLPELCAGFEIDNKKLQKVLESKKNQYKAISKYPAISADVCIRVNDERRFSEVETALRSELVKLLEDDITFTASALDIYQAENSSDKQITWRLTIVSHERTLLTDYVTEKISQAVIAIPDATQV